MHEFMDKLFLILFHEILYLLFLLKLFFSILLAALSKYRDNPDNIE